MLRDLIQVFYTLVWGYTVFLLHDESRNIQKVGQILYGFYDIDICLGSVAIPAETLIKHFSGIFYTDREPLLFVDPDWHFDHLSQDGVFTDAELLTAINDLNAQAAVGPERIPSSVLKEVFQDSSTRAPLLALMNLCFSQGTVPADWGLSEIFVLYKLKGSRDDPNNYRGINLINDFCKIYERLIEQRFQLWMFDSAPPRAHAIWF